MRVSRFLAGFALGLVLGAAAILLTTPQSGNMLQTDVRTRWDNALAEGRKAAKARRAELEARLASLKNS